MAFAMLAPPARIGEMTRDAPARSILRIAPASSARLMMKTSGLSCRALRVITMFSLSEFVTHAMHRACMRPARTSVSSAVASPVSVT